jgi:hypothetical protein
MRHWVGRAKPPAQQAGAGWIQPVALQGCLSMKGEGGGVWVRRCISGVAPKTGSRFVSRETTNHLDWRWLPSVFTHNAGVAFPTDRGQEQYHELATALISLIG